MSPARSLPPLRASVERRSAVLAVYLSGRRGLVFVLVLAAVVAFLVLPGALSLLVGVPFVAGLAWLTYLRHPYLGRGPQLGRVVVLLAVVVIVVTKAV